MRHLGFALGTLLLFACGLRASSNGTPSTSGTTPGGDDTDGGTTTVAPDGSVPPFDAGTSPGNLIVDAAFDTSPAACSASAIARLPPELTLADSTFAASPTGLDLLLYDQYPPGGYVLGALSFPGGLSVLETPSGGGTFTTSLVQSDQDAVYFVESVPGPSQTLFSVARGGGAHTTVATLGVGSLVAYALGATDAWLDVRDQMPGADAIYLVPKTGGAVGVLAYAVPAGSQVTSLFLDTSNPGAPVLYWVEVAPQLTEASLNVTVRSAPAVGPTLVPSTFATFGGGGNIALAELYGTVFVAGTRPIMPPVPPPPGGGGDGGGGPPPVYAITTGLYTIAQNGAPVLVDPNAAGPLFAGAASVFYTTSDTAFGVPRIDALPVGGAPYTIVPQTSALAAFGGVHGIESVYYVLNDGCVYEWINAPKK